MISNTIIKGIHFCGKQASEIVKASFSLHHEVAKKSELTSHLFQINEDLDEKKSAISLKDYKSINANNIPATEMPESAVEKIFNHFNNNISDTKNKIEVHEHAAKDLKIYKVTCSIFIYSIGIITPIIEVITFMTGAILINPIGLLIIFTIVTALTLTGFILNTKSENQYQQADLLKKDNTIREKFTHKIEKTADECFDFCKEQIPNFNMTRELFDKIIYREIQNQIAKKINENAEDASLDNEKKVKCMISTLIDNRKSIANAVKQEIKKALV